MKLGVFRVRFFSREKKKEKGQGKVTLYLLRFGFGSENNEKQKGGWFSAR